MIEDNLKEANGLDGLECLGGSDLEDYCLEHFSFHDLEDLVGSDNSDNSDNLG